MAKTAFLFPGQGSQTIGMASALAHSSPVAREVLARIDDSLGISLSGLMAKGPAEELQLTLNAQPALFASSLASLKVIEEMTGMPVPALCDYVAGHSLGEYSALCAAGSLGISQTAGLLRLRGEAMQKAVPVNEGTMAVLIGADIALVQTVVEQAISTGLVQIANDNAAGQIVISGVSRAVEAAMEIAKDMGVKRVMKLPVSAPFHCELMAPAADAMAIALAEVSMHNASVPVVCNVTASGEQMADKLRLNLITQVTGRVRWRETIDYLAVQGVTRFIEIGTGKVLCGLVKRSVPDAQIYAVDTQEDIKTAFQL